jgi:hypothetical protein
MYYAIVGGYYVLCGAEAGEYGKWLLKNVKDVLAAHRSGSLSDALWYQLDISRTRTRSFFADIITKMNRRTVERTC